MQKVENIVANGEIAHFEQFLILPQYFQKSSVAEASESVYRWEMVNFKTYMYEGQIFVWRAPISPVLAKV